MMDSNNTALRQGSMHCQMVVALRQVGVMLGEGRDKLELSRQAPEMEQGTAKSRLSSNHLEMMARKWEP